MTLRAEALTAGHNPGAPLFTDFGLTVTRGRTLGLTGPSGAGKSTLARVLAGLHAPDSGTVTLDGRAPRPGKIAMVWQSPWMSASPRWSLSDIIAEPARIRGLRAAERRAVVAAAADEVGLTADLLGRRAHQVSGGQLQRACLARALTQQPEFLICDEMTAMLDPATAAALVAVLRARCANGLGVLAISHDHALLEAWADERRNLARPTPDATEPAY